MKPEITKCLNQSTSTLAISTIVHLHRESLPPEKRPRPYDELPITVYAKTPAGTKDENGFFIYPDGTAEDRHLPTDLKRRLETMKSFGCSFLLLDDIPVNQTSVFDCMTISTAHIPQNVMERFKTKPTPGVYLKNDIGAYVYVNRINMAKWKKSALMACVQFAKNANCGILCFDSDGPVVDGLKTFQYK